MTGVEPPGDAAAWDHESYVAEFVRAARPAVADGLAAWGGELDDLRADEDAVHVTATVRFRGHRFAFRRRVWPPDHPVGLKASLYATRSDCSPAATPHRTDPTTPSRSDRT